jgi:hypothetical protein
MEGKTKESSLVATPDGKLILFESGGCLANQISMIMGGQRIGRREVRTEFTILQIPFPRNP